MPDDKLPRLMATFRPQAWQNDYALDIDGARKFDATKALMDFTHFGIRKFRFHDNDTDVLASETPGVTDDHDGPFEVDVDEDEWTAFFKAHGVKDYHKITARQWQDIRTKYMANTSKFAIHVREDVTKKYVIRAETAEDAKEEYEMNSAELSGELVECHTSHITKIVDLVTGMELDPDLID